MLHHVWMFGRCILQFSFYLYNVVIILLGYLIYILQIVQCCFFLKIYLHIFVYLTLYFTRYTNRYLGA